jgi:hypothetical protein
MVTASQIDSQHSGSPTNIARQASCLAASSPPKFELGGHHDKINNA